jgi:hypothetical protein
MARVTIVGMLRDRKDSAACEYRFHWLRGKWILNDVVFCNDGAEPR